MLSSFLSFSLISAARPIDPLRFEKDIAAFEKEDKMMMPPEGAIVITGSSSIRRWHPTIKEDLAPLTVIPRGFGGSTMADALHYVDRIIIPYKPRAVVIYEGDNDSGSYGVPPAKIGDELKQIISAIHELLPRTRIYIISVKPSLARLDKWDKAQETNELFLEMATRNDKLSYIDIATPLLNSNGKVMDDVFVEDRLHLNDKGYRIWTAAIRAALMAGEAKYE